MASEHQTKEQKANADAALVFSSQAPVGVGPIRGLHPCKLGLAWAGKRERQAKPTASVARTKCLLRKTVAGSIFSIWDHCVLRGGHRIPDQERVVRQHEGTLKSDSVSIGKTLRKLSDEINPKP